MRLRLVPTILLLSAWTWAAEPSPAPVLPGKAVEVQLADGKDLLAHWETTPWAKMWADPALKPLHKPFAEAQAEAAKDLGATPTELLAAMANAALTVNYLPAASPAAGKPVLPLTVSAGADFGNYAAKLFTFFKNTADTSSTKSRPATVAGADEAISHPSQPEAIFARFATGLAFGFQTPPVRPQAHPNLKDDLFAHADIARIFEMLGAAMPSGSEHDSILRAKQQLAEMKLSEATYRMQIIPEGFLEKVDVGVVKTIGYKPVDRALLARLPANVLMVGAIGYDSVEAWKFQRSPLLANWAPLLGCDPADSDATEKAINAKFKEFGLDVSLAEAFTAFTGTSFIAITPSMPFPAATIAIPRSPVADKLIALGLGKLGSQVPAEGSSVIIPIPNAPVVATLVCDKSAWLVSSDTVLADQWLSGKADNGWTASAAGSLALSKAPADAYLIAASDTPAVMRLLAGYAGMGLTMAKQLTPEQRQAIIQGFNVLAAAASPGYAVAGSVKGRQITEVRSLTGVVPGVFIIGGIAGTFSYMRQQALHERGPHNGPEAAEKIADPTLPVTVLRQNILPAQEQFKAGLYRDQDGDGIGEYALLSELNGRRDVGEGQRLALLSGPLARGATVGGYSYTIYLPGGATRVADDGKAESRTSVPANADAQEKTFVAYAWPARTKDGMMYALVNNVVYETPYNGMPPAWNAVFDGAGFEAKPKWAMSAGSSTGSGTGTGNSTATEPANVP